MEDLSSTGLLPFIAVVLVVDAIALIDIVRVREVKHLPRPAWAAIVLLSFPLGVLAYALLGREPDGEPVPAPPTPPDGETPPPPPNLRARRAGPTDVPAVTTRRLTRVFGETVAVDGVDLLVPRGSIYGLIGPNGAGKTTLLSMLTGLRSPTEGDVTVEVPTSRISVLPDTPSFEPWLTAREVVDLARTLQDPDLPARRVDEAIAQVGLTEVADRRVKGISRGMLQRLGLASCLVSDPELLLLDEPSSALDPTGRREVLDLISRLAGDRTVVLSTHILSDVQRVCDTVGVLDEGRLRYQGPLTDLLHRTGAVVHLTVRPPDDRVVEVLEGSTVVEQVERDAPGQLVVHLAEAAAAERELLRLLVEADAELLSLVPATDLETAFLELLS